MFSTLSVAATVPAQDAILYGSFTALAQSGLPGPHGGLHARGAGLALALALADARGIAMGVFRPANVDLPQGVFFPTLVPGVYDAPWVLRDANGQTRTLITTLVEES